MIRGLLCDRISISRSFTESTNAKITAQSLISMQSEIKHYSNFTIPQFATKKTRNVEIKQCLLLKRICLWPHSPSTVKDRMGFPYYEKCLTFFPFHWRLLWGLRVGRCKTEGVRLNKRFVSVLHDWHRADLNRSGEAVRWRKDKSLNLHH